MKLLRPEWPAPNWVRAVSTMRAEGFSKGAYAGCNLGMHVGDDPSVVQQNREHLAASMPGVEVVWLNQIHGTDVTCLDAVYPCILADAAYTHRSKRACAVMTADCLPVLLCDTKTPMVAAVHCGWRGLAQGIIANVIHKMAQPGKQLLAWLGPAIGPSHYEVGADVRDAFLAHDKRAAEGFISHAQNKWHMNLPLLAQQALEASGVEQVYNAAIDTYQDTRFYSYRRDVQTGRQASLIWIET